MSDPVAPRRPFTLVRGGAFAPRCPLHDTSGDDYPLTPPTPAPRGVHTAPWFWTEGVPVRHAVDSRGVSVMAHEVRTVGELREVNEELERFLDAVDPRGTPLSVETIAG